MNLFSSPPAPVVAPPPTPPTKEATAEQSEEERRKAVLDAANRRGRANTILAGAEGDTSPAASVRKELLGA